MIQADWAGDERCTLLTEIEEEISELESLPEDQKDSILWAIDYILKRYRCRESDYLEN